MRHLLVITRVQWESPENRPSRKMERITHLLLLLMFLLIPGHHCGKGKQRVPVGTIFSVDDFPALAAIKHEFDSHANETTSFEVDALVKQVKSYDPIHVKRAVCQLLDLGVYAIISPSDAVAGSVLSSLSNQFHLPVVCPVFPETSQIPRFGVSLSPSTTRAMSDVIQLYRWNALTFFYDTADVNGPRTWHHFSPISEGLQRFQQLLDHNPKLMPGGLHSVTSAKDVKHILRKLDVAGPVPVALATSFHLAVDVIEAVNKDSYFIDRGFHFLLMNPTTEKLPLTSSVHATYLQLTEGVNVTRKSHGKSNRRMGTASLKDLIFSSIDAADVVLQTLSNLAYEHPHVLRDAFKMSEISCLREEKLPWQHGSLVSQFLRHSHISDGMTGNVQFGSKGQRRRFSFDVIETTQMEHLKMATWSDETGLKVIENPSMNIFLRDTSDETNPLKGKRFRMTTIQDIPFLFKNEGNNEFEGYLKDLMDTLSTELSFTYDMHIVKDGMYGTMKNGEWTGMVGEILRDEADFAIAPLTITSLRESVIDFSKPFMSAGVTVMIKKPDPATTMSPASSTFFFLHAFSYDVWICFIVTYVSISALSWAISRFTGAPDFVTQSDTEQKFSVSNSFWCSVSQLMLRGAGIYPRSASHRLITLVWWLFTLVAVAMFTSNMASMIIQEKTGMGASIGAPLGDAYSVMEEAITRGVPELGLLKGGSTEAFFKGAKIKLYKKYADYLYKNPDVAVKSYAEGIERVRQSDGKYALLIESSNNEYTSSKMPCDTVMVPGTFNSINYGIGMKQNSPYRIALDHGLLKLKEKGELRMLYNRWWKDDNVCEQMKRRRKFTDMYSSSLTLSQVAGLFYVFIIGSLLAFVAAVAEYLLKTRMEKLLHRLELDTFAAAILRR